MSKALCSARLPAFPPRGEPHFSLRRPPQVPPPRQRGALTLCWQLFGNGAGGAGARLATQHFSLHLHASPDTDLDFGVVLKISEKMRKGAPGMESRVLPSPCPASERLLGEQKGKNLGKSPGHCSGTQSQQLCWDPSRHRGLEGAQDAAPSCPRIVTGPWQGDTEKIHRFGRFVEKRVTKK